MKTCSATDYTVTLNKWFVAVCPAHLSACEDVSGQLDLGKVALPNGFKQPVVANMGLLRLIRAAGPYARPG